ncbi:hypothetical protein CFC21_092851 [Triticum aestivum]|uniref:Uncharacterized protein n=2 Tax=Triticum aestivum TaxID=4565 RepID=A0A3B6QI11_WHEAT|nr:hypothetical protein CFC21_092851 [Triticum aestivum]
MAKGGKAKKGPASGGQPPPQISHLVLFQGEAYELLSSYTTTHPARVDTDQPVGQSAVPAKEPEQLGPSTRRLVFSLADALDDLVNSAICLEKLEDTRVAVTPDGRIKFVEAIFVERKDLPSLREFKIRVAENYNDLAGIITRYLSPVSHCIPAEVTHLLYLMRNRAWEMRYLITYHSATVPLGNRSDLFLIMHSYVWEVLRKTDPGGYEYVMASLEYDPDWRNAVVNNEHLQKYYYADGGGLYESNAQLQGDEHRQVMRFNHDGQSHPLEHAADSSAPSGMLYNPVQLGHMYHANFARLTYSMQAALHAIDRLRCVGIKSLFSNDSKEYQEIR